MLGISSGPLMLVRVVATCLISLCLLVPAAAVGQFADGYAAFERGDYEAALRVWRPLAEAGDDLAQYSLGVIYYEGLSVPKDFVEAAIWFRLAAQQGNEGAEYSLGVMYAEGRGVRPDAEQAVRWFRLAADHGVDSAQFNLGLMYATGRGVPADPVVAYAWFILAAEQGHAEARIQKWGMEGVFLTTSQIRQGEALAEQWRTQQKAP